MDYLDFVLRLDLGDHGGLTVRLVESPAGEAEAPFVPPAVQEEVERTAQDFERRAGTGDDMPSRDVISPLSAVTAERQRKIGAQLFEALLPGPVRDRYYQCLGHLGPRPNLGLRIKLQMGFGDPRLVGAHSLPWECLHRSEDGAFLGRERRTSVARHLDLPLPGARPSLEGPLRVLVVAALPRGLRPLPHLERERSALVDLARRRKGLEVVSLATPTLDALREAFLSGGFHVLHFLGHGGFEAATGEGLLYLEDGSGGVAPVSGSLLADHLRDITSLRLVVLNACQTARSAAPGPFGGVATALLRTGVPAVVAMQFPISDRAASAFSAAFYKRLTAGDPIDAAVAEGRLRIRRDLPDSAEWATPALFLRAADGRLFSPGREPARRPWAVAGAAAVLAAVVLAGSLLLDRDRKDTTVRDQPDTVPVEESRPAEPSLQMESTAPETRGSEGSGQPTAPPVIQNDQEELTSAAPLPSSPTPAEQDRPARRDGTPRFDPAKPRARRTPATYKLSDRQPVFLPEIQAHLTANFNVVYGELVVTLVLAPDGAPGVRQAVMGPGSVELQMNQETYRIEVLAIDEADRSITVLPGITQ